MKKIISLLLTLVMIFGSLLTLVSCGAPDDDGAEINIYLGYEVFDFDPSDYYVSDAAEQVLSLLYEPLFKLKKNGKLQCAAADDYDVDEDERKIVITLRETYWSDNIKVKASDYVYAWCNRIINASNPNPAAALFYEIEGVKEVMNGEGSIYDVGIKATEMDQITITYCEGADYERILKNLASVATSPVRQDIVESGETYWSKYTAVTNGAFKIKSYDSYDEDKSAGTFELTRNIGYHQDPTTTDYDDEVRPGMLYGEFTIPGSDISVSYEDIEDKVVFVMAEASLADRKEYEDEAYTADRTSTYTYVFNTNNPLFADANVRLALSTVIDRDDIIDLITFGHAASGFLPEICGGDEDGIISTSGNYDKAMEYLAKADLTGISKSFTLTIDGDEQSVEIAKLVETAWESLGFDVTVAVAEPVQNSVPDGTIYDSGIQYLVKDASYGIYNYDVIAVDWQMYSRDGAVGLLSLTSNLNGMGTDYASKRENIAGWSDSHYDALVAEAIACEDEDDREDKLAEAEEYLMSQMPVCPLVFNQTFEFESSKIRKLRFDGLGNIVMTNVKLRDYDEYLKPEDEDEE